jgi:hypothetical protein
VRSEDGVAAPPLFLEIVVVIGLLSTDDDDIYDLKEGLLATTGLLKILCMLASSDCCCMSR